MDEFRFVHAADLHLDTPFTGIGLSPAPVASVLRDASLRAWDGLVRLTIESRAACLLLSGGLYDGADFGLRAQVALRDGLQTLAESDIPVFIVLGGRDRIDAWSVLSEWPNNVTIFDANATSIPLLRAGKHLATIHGASHPAGDIVQHLRRTFDHQNPSELHIGLLHCGVGGDGETASWESVPLVDLCELPVRYWALGSEQVRRYVSRDPWIVFPGTPQGRAANPDGATNGACLVEVANGAIQQVSFEALDTVRFGSVEIRDAGRLEQAEVCRQALDQAQELRRQNPGRALLLEVRLSGEAPPSGDLVSRLESELRAATEDWDPIVWWTVSAERAGPESPRSARGRRSEIASLVLDRSDALLGAVLPRSSFLARQLEPLRGVWEAELDLDEAKALMHEATSLAIEALTKRPIE